MFENGNFPFWYSNCTVEKVWDPAEVEECIRKYKYSLDHDVYYGKNEKQSIS